MYTCGVDSRSATTTARLKGRAPVKEDSMIRIKCVCGRFHTFMIKYRGQDVSAVCECGRTIAVDTRGRKRIPRAMVIGNTDEGQAVPVQEVA